MASLQTIQKRIKSVKAVHKITSAMELVAATKMRRAQETALNSRPYAFAALEMLASTVQAAARTGVDLSGVPLLKTPASKTHAILLITSDKGLAGTFNSAVFRKYEQFAAKHASNKTEEKKFAIVAVGQKAEDYAKRRGLNVVKSFTRHGDIVESHETEELGDFLINGFVEGHWGRLTVFATNFVSALKQEAISRELLPIHFEKIREGVDEIVPKTGKYSELKKRIEAARPEHAVEYLIEPSPEVALGKLAPALFKMQIYHLVLESNASEHSARRLAMKNASDNAAELTDELSTLYNRARQEQITKELLEITGTARALNG